jgi:hypothetical protein
MKTITLLITSAVLLLLPFGLVAEQKASNIVKSIDIQLIEKTRFNKNEPIKKVFKDFEYEGWLNSEGDWNIKGKVTHNRLRCAHYELGIQLGKGAPACLNVEWLAEIYYGTRKEQCNSVAMNHSGGGEIELLTTDLKDITCVKVVTKCTGTCDK